MGFCVPQLSIFLPLRHYIFSVIIFFTLNDVGERLVLVQSLFPMIKNKEMLTRCALICFYSNTDVYLTCFVRACSNKLTISPWPWAMIRSWWCRFFNKDKSLMQCVGPKAKTSVLMISKVVSRERTRIYNWNSPSPQLKCKVNPRKSSIPYQVIAQWLVCTSFPYEGKLTIYCQTCQG